MPPAPSCLARDHRQAWRLGRGTGQPTGQAAWSRLPGWLNRSLHRLLRQCMESSPESGLLGALLDQEPAGESDWDKPLSQRAHCALRFPQETMDRLGAVDIPSLSPATPRIHLCFPHTHRRSLPERSQRHERTTPGSNGDVPFDTTDPMWATLGAASPTSVPGRNNPCLIGPATSAYVRHSGELLGPQGSLYHAQAAATPSRLGRRCKPSET